VREEEEVCAEGEEGIEQHRSSVDRDGT
jgi:hypothetical protein